LALITKYLFVNGYLQSITRQS